MIRTSLHRCGGRISALWPFFREAPSERSHLEAPARNSHSSASQVTSMTERPSSSSNSSCAPVSALLRMYPTNDDSAVIEECSAASSPLFSRFEPPAAPFSLPLPFSNE